VSSSAIRSVLESMLGSVLESVLGAYLGVCNEVHLAVLLNAARCIVSSAHNCMCIIVIWSMRRSVGSHSATRQICYGLPSQKLVLYELRVV